MPKVSVIVPVYNVEPYLRQCLDSIVSQTLKDIEIILIDDGSTDGSGEICDEYKREDHRIRVIHKVNEGLSAARNDGIDASTAPYIMFVDGDDWVEPEFCETPCRVASNNKADLVLFSYNKVFNNGRIKRTDARTQQGPLNEAEAMRYNVFYACYAWIGLYHRKLFNDVRYPIGMIQEDVGTGHRLIHAARDIRFINAHLYNYRVRRKGSITTAWDAKRNSDVKEMLTRRVNDLSSWGYEEFARKDALSLLVWFGWKQDDQKRFFDIVRRTEKSPTVDYTWKQRLQLLLFMKSPVLFDVFCVFTGMRVKIGL